MSDSNPLAQDVERVVGGVLRRDDRVLLCLRNRDRKHYPGVWDVPGGHVSDDESCEEGLVRELQEELGIHAQVLSTDLLAVETVRDVEFHLFVVDDWDGNIRNCAPDEHEELRWVTLPDLSQLPLAHPSYVSLLGTALASRE